MSRLPIAVALLVGFAGAANAATLTLSSDKPTYGVGETIVLEVVGWAEYLDAAKSIYARVLYDAALTEGVSASQRIQPRHNMAPPGDFRPRPRPIADGFATPLDQVLGITPVTVATRYPTIGTATLIAEAAGVVHVNYLIESGDEFTLNYFGITSAPGISFLIVPEPAPALLLGLGLLGLRYARQSRR